jgi:hypothetical protein
MLADTASNHGESICKRYNLSRSHRRNTDVYQTFYPQQYEYSLDNGNKIQRKQQCSNCMNATIKNVENNQYIFSRGSYV